MGGAKPLGRPISGVKPSSVRTSCLYSQVTGVFVRAVDNRCDDHNRGGDWIDGRRELSPLAVQSVERRLASSFLCQARVKPTNILRRSVFYEPKYHGRMKSRHWEPRLSGLKKHSLGLAVGSIVALWFVLYERGDPSTHRGAFYGNALADWLGSLMIVITTKYLYELGSAESRQPHSRTRNRLTRFAIDHSLTIVLVVTGVAWGALYSALDPQGKAGQVVGNIASEWTQLLGLVIMTKYLREIGSKESK